MEKQYRAILKVAKQMRVLAEQLIALAGKLIDAIETPAIKDEKSDE